MAYRIAPQGNNNQVESQANESPFEAFPEPRGFFANWQGSALHNTPPPTTTPSKPPQA